MKNQEEIKNLKKGKILSNEELREVFGCSNQGGMRKSCGTNTLVVVANHTIPPYKDEWKNGVLHYIGMGLDGNQDLNYKQNRTLKESNTNGVKVHLFEVEKKREYKYKGQVELCGAPYEGNQRDQNGENRKVWIFPLKLKNSNEK